MIQRSPILRFALELFEQALEKSVTSRPRDRKIAVLHLAQCVELAVKAALVEKNVSIYLRDKTVNTHEARRQLCGIWGVERLTGEARLELLIDERNAIQHRYGDVDDVTLDYHLETTFQVLSEVLDREFDLDLSDWVRDNVDESVWKRVRFVQPPDEEPSPPSASSLPDRSATLDLVAGFAAFEDAIRKAISDAGARHPRYFSTLDLVIKSLASLPSPPRDIIRDLPTVYRLRNRVIHGEAEAPSDSEVESGLKLLDAVLVQFANVDPDLVRRAIRTTQLGVRGARVLTWEEIRDRETPPPDEADGPAPDPALPPTAT
jgi:HEPN domain-containing protein